MKILEFQYVPFESKILLIIGIIYEIKKWDIF